MKSLKFVLILMPLIVGCAVLRYVKPRLPAPHRVDGGIKFQFYAPAAKYVNLAGDFNRWAGTADGRFDPSIGRMYDDGTHGDDKAGDGVWTIIVDLKPGVYQYKFVVDGTAWYTDPSNPETVQEGPYVNSLLRVE